MKNHLALGIALAGAVALASAPGCGGSESSTPGATDSKTTSSPSVNAQAVKGALVFKKTCATCHGENARGMPDNGPDMHNNEFVKSNTDDQLFEYVVTGRVVEDGADMPPRGGFTEAQLPDEDIRRVLAYIRTMPGNAAP